MATGTGKTFTAIKAIEAIESQEGKCIVGIVVPQTDLQEQWRAALEEEGIQCRLFGGLAKRPAEDEFDNVVIDFYDGDETIVFVAVNITFFDKVVKGFGDLTDAKRLLVVDEVHTLSKSQIDRLPDVDYRLGLSATPKRFSQDETDSIIDYFTNGAVKPFAFGIEDAIGMGFLSRYYYHPILVAIDEDDFEEFSKWQKRIATLMNAEIIDQDKLEEARLARSRVLKKAPAKLRKLERMVSSSDYSFVNSVVYCGQGNEPGTDDSIIDRTIGILAEEGGYTVSSFTTKTINRVAVIKEFENGFFDTLVAIKCFDQGVDVPKLDKIFIMASDASTRQTIQRRGRVLRKCSETGKQFANIYDMILVPPITKEASAPAKSLLQIELGRAREYGRIAENWDQVEETMLQLMRDNDIEELSGEAENDDID